MLILIVFLHALKYCTALIETTKLIALDEHLTKLLIEPQPGKGKELLKDSEFLYKNLDELLDLVDQKKPEGSEIYKEIEKAGGIKFSNTTYNPAQLKETYKFSDDDLDYLKANVVEVRSNWKCMGVLLNFTLPYSGEHFYERMAEKVRENERLRGEPEQNFTSSMSTSELDN